MDSLRSTSSLENKIESELFNNDVNTALSSIEHSLQYLSQTCEVMISDLIEPNNQGLSILLSTLATATQQINIKQEKAELDSRNRLKEVKQEAEHNKLYKDYLTGMYNLNIALKGLQQAFLVADSGGIDEKAPNGLFEVALRASDLQINESRLSEIAKTLNITNHQAPVSNFLKQRQLKIKAAQDDY